MKIAQEGRADAAWPIHAPTPQQRRELHELKTAHTPDSGWRVTTIP
jgi:hypothetical protein